MWAGYPGDRPRRSCAASTSTSRPGRRVALVGPSGAGKSTLADVLVRFLPVDAGEATLDGVPLDRLAADDVRRWSGWSSRARTSSTRPWPRTCGWAGARPPTTSWRAVLGRVGLGDWLAGLPAGLATEVGPAGARLSGGQRQRVAVARALLADFSILVLDEPAEHLDPAAADALTADLLPSPRAARRCSSRTAWPGWTRSTRSSSSTTGASSSAAPTPSSWPPAAATPACGGTS